MFEPIGSLELSQWPLLYAVGVQNTEAVKDLLKRGWGGTAVYGDQKIVELLRTAMEIRGANGKLLIGRYALR